jgi:hypothetical protein
MLKKLGIFLIVASMCLTLGYGQAMATAEDAPGGIGDLLLFPIYDVTETDERVGIPWENYFVIQNTSDNWVACHLRFRAGTKSIEVYDHILLLSPYDVFFADMMRTSGGGVSITSSDTETLRNSGLIAADETSWSTEFSIELLEDCGYTEDLLTETERGYIEVIGLWSIVSTSSDIADITGDTYDDPNDPDAKNVYDILYSVWGGAVDGNRPTLTPTSKSLYLEDCPNVITGSMEMGDAVTGMYQLENFVALSSFRTDDTDSGGTHRDGLAGGEIVYPVGLLIPGGRCYTTSTTAWYLNPDWATTIGPTLRDGDDADKLGGTDFSDEWSLNEVEAALAKTEIWGYYLNDAFSAEIDTDVVLTLPTKHHHLLFTAAAVLGPWPYWIDGLPASGSYIHCGIYWTDINDFRAEIADEMDDIYNGPVFIEGKIWDTDENPMGLSPAPSPSPWTVPTLEHEVNVVRVGDEGILDTDYTHGQFQLKKWILDGGERTAFSGTTCQLPIIGMTIRTHHVGGAAAYRSAMTRLQYK